MGTMIALHGEKSVWYVRPERIAALHQTANGVDVYLEGDSEEFSVDESIDQIVRKISDAMDEPNILH